MKSLLQHFFPSDLAVTITFRALMLHIHELDDDRVQGRREGKGNIAGTACYALFGVLLLVWL